jgi:hypothetical protein
MTRDELILKHIGNPTANLRKDVEALLDEYSHHYLTSITGKDFDPNGDYFLLRLDAGDNLKASRAAINTFADGIDDKEKAEDLKKRYPLI